MRPEVVARLTTESATHELLRCSAGYSIVTTSGGALVAEKSLTTSEAMEWCETVVRCGGVRYGRQAAS